MDGSNRPSRLRDYIASEVKGLHSTLRYYLFRAGLNGREQPLDAAADELLNEVVHEALKHEERFAPDAQPRAWLLGIAANLVRRQQSEVFRRGQREPLARDLYPGLEDGMSDDELFDWMIEQSEHVLTEGVDGDELADALLSRVSDDDGRVLRLAILHGLDGAALAKELGVSPGAARVRLHRAITRLRAAFSHEEAAR